VARDLDLGDEEYDREDKGEPIPAALAIEGAEREQREDDRDHADDAGER